MQAIYVISNAAYGDKIQPTIPFSCDLCEFFGKSSGDLKVHNHRKHNNIPQLDAGNFRGQKNRLQPGGRRS